MRRPFDKHSGFAEDPRSVQGQSCWLCDGCSESALPSSTDIGRMDSAAILVRAAGLEPGQLFQTAATNPWGASEIGPLIREQQTLRCCFAVSV